MKSSLLFYYNPGTKWIDREGEVWTDALALGNGRIGAMIPGRWDEEVISLNHDTLWSGIPHFYPSDTAYEGWQEAIALVRKRKYFEAQCVLDEKCVAPEAELYLPLGDMTLEFDAVDSVTDYRRTLDLDTAVCTVDYKMGEVKYHREHFISFPDDIFVTKITTDTSGKINMRVGITSQLKTEISAIDDTLIMNGECPGASKGSRPNIIYTYYDEPEKKGVLFGGRVKVIASGGEMIAEDGKIVVRNADEVIILTWIKTSYNGAFRLPATEGKDYIGELETAMEGSETFDYDSVLERHIADYQSLYNRTVLDLGENIERVNMPTDERLEKFCEDHDDNGMYTLFFNFAKYLIISSSREGTCASNLQGIWNGSICPKWKSNYTLNINTEMNYWPVLMCDLPECFEPLIKLTKDLCVSGRKTAENWYHANGFVAHHNSDVWGHSTPVLKASVGCWNGTSGWLCHQMYEYYQYTMDIDFLKNTAYPMMKEAAEFYLDTLSDRGDGKLSIMPSTSPENSFKYIDDEGNEKVSSVAAYTAMSDSVVYNLFIDCLCAMDEISLKDEKWQKRLTNAIEHMEPLVIGSDGRIMEWNEEFVEIRPRFGHISHMYALYPGNIVNWEDTPELMEACIKTTDNRGKHGGWPGAWRVGLYAKAKMGNAALEHLNIEFIPTFLENGNGRPIGTLCKNMLNGLPVFQIDGNMGNAAGLLEMFVGYKNGEVEFLPALPDRFKDGSLYGVRTKGGKVYDIEWKDGKLTKAVVRE